MRQRRGKHWAAHINLTLTYALVLIAEPRNPLDRYAMGKLWVGGVLVGWKRLEVRRGEAVHLSDTD